MSFLSDLPREWVTIQVPGTSSQTMLVTYVGYPVDQLPAAPVDVAGLEWLKHAPRHPDGDLGSAFEHAARDISSQAVADLLGDLAAVPNDFAQFLEDAGLRDRLRSATNSYFDLGDSVAAVDGGRLLHLISDSQWTFHWLLYLGDDGSSAIVGTSFPAGFALDPDETQFWQDHGWGYILVAGSFAEFLWRWWMDNEIFYRVVVEKVDMSADERAYVEQYGLPNRLG
ncbi:hypothetical protein E0H75_27780 [Kribbella capetownensis]|uniref:Uncharacterized protein n=1 Tax=Kribbella capetownensis TaxID=1572659 RepID=A0A4R0JIM2_9ACTN|nr:hypothetical protein [Kribbella capetownensis]TCC46841.1 hypothetical protein E0H75_27780 [Kribbella capetownensis]